MAFENYLKSLVFDGEITEEDTQNPEVINVLQGEYNRGVAIENPDAANSFLEWKDELVRDGTISSDVTASPKATKALLSEFEKSHADPIKGKVKRAAIEDAGSVQDLELRREEILRQRESGEADGNFANGIDKLQKTFGEGLDMLGDYFGSNSFVDNVVDGVAGGSYAKKLGETLFGKSDVQDDAVLNFVSDNLKIIGTNIVEQQERDIDAGNYQPVYQGSLTDQESVSDAAGWVLEGMMNNAPQIVSTIGLAGVAAVTAPISATAASVVGGVAGSSAILQGLGGVSEELKDKKVYDSEELGLSVAAGTIIGMADVFGMTRLFPKGLILKKFAQNGTLDKVAKEIAETGILREAGKGVVTEGLTEVIQEGAQMLVVAGQGGEYEQEEVMDRMIDSFVLGGAFGAVGGATKGGIIKATDAIRARGEEPTPASVLREVQAENEAISQIDDPEVLDAIASEDVVAEIIAGQPIDQSGQVTQDVIADTQSEDIDADAQPIVEPEVEENSGNTVVVIDADINRHEVKYSVVEADELTASIDKGENQFRNRNRQELKQQVDRISKNLEPELLKDSRKLEDGSPVLSKDGLIVSGNGRTQSIQKAYNDGNGDAYKNSVISDADSFGISPDIVSGMDKPVLIRTLVDDVDVESISLLSNEGGGAAISPLDQAKIDAKRIGTLDGFIPSESGDIDSQSASSLFSRLVDETPADKRDGLKRTDGTMSLAAKNRIQNALIYMAYGDNKFLEDAIESDDVNVVNTRKALIAVSPKFAEIRDLINQGSVYDADISSDVIDAVGQFSKIKSNGESVTEFLNQEVLFDEVPERTKILIRKFEETTRSPKALREFLSNYADILKSYGNPNQESLVSQIAPTKDEVLARAEQGSEFRRNESGETDGVTSTETTEQPRTTVDDGASVRPESGGDGGSIPPTVNTANQPEPEPERTYEEITESRNPEKRKNNLKEFFKKWLGSDIRKVGVENVNTRDRYNAYVQQSARTVTESTRAIKRWEKEAKVKITDEQKKELHKYTTSDFTYRSRSELPVELKGIGDGMRENIDRRTTLFMQREAKTASRVLGREVTVDELLQFGNIDWETEGDQVVKYFEESAGVEGEQARSAALTVAKLAETTQTLDNNIGSYLTRSYKIHDNPESWRKHIQSNDPEAIELRRNAHSYFMRGLAITQPELTTKQREDVAFDEVDKFILAHVRENSSPLNMAGAQDGVLRQRSQELANSPELRGLLGEHLDPLTAYAKSIQRMDNLLALQDFHNELYERTDPQGNRLIQDEQAPDNSLVQVNVAKGALINPMHGKFASPEMAEFINTTFNEDNAGPYWEALRRSNAMWQVITVPLSIGTSAANIISTIPVAVATGSLTPKIFNDTMNTLSDFYIKDSTRDFKGEYGMDRKDLFDAMIANDILSGGALEGELRKYIDEGNFDSIGDLMTTYSSSKTATAVNKTSKAGKVAFDAAMSVFALGDSLPKVMIFLAEMKHQEQLKQKYGEDVVKDGVNLAAHSAKQQAPQYSRIVKAVEASRQNPFFGQFVAFKAQLYQTTWNQTRINMALIAPERNVDFLKEHKGIDLDAVSPEARESLVADLQKLGLKKQTFQLATLTGASAAMGAVISAFGDGDEPTDEEMEAINALMPEWNRFNSKAYLRRDENDNPVFINTSRMTMYGDLETLARIPYAYLNGQIASGGDAAKLMADNIASPFYSPTYVSRTIADTVRGEDEYGRAIITTEDGLIGNAANVASYMAKELLTNGTTKIASEIYQDLVSQEEYHDRTGIEYDASLASMSAFGMQPIRFDPNKQLASTMMTMKFDSAQLRRRLNGKMKSFHDLDDDGLESMLLTFRDEHVRLNQDNIIRIEAARALGMSEEDILQAVKTARLSKKTYLNYLSVGEIPPFMIDKLGSGSIDGINFRKLSDGAKESFTKNYENARRIANSLPATSPF